MTKNPNNQMKEHTMHPSTPLVAPEPHLHIVFLSDTDPTTRVQDEINSALDRHEHLVQTCINEKKTTLVFRRISDTETMTDQLNMSPSVA